MPSEGTGGVAARMPLFRFDPGWPFVIAGLALIVSAVLIPAQRELHDLEQELAVHQAHEERANAELLAYNQFLADIGRGDERLLERLVRAQLNRMPKGERPLLLMPSANDTVPAWIESSVVTEIPEPTPYPDTLLSRIATGPRRLWVLATGAFLVFIGVMFAPTMLAPRRTASPRPRNAPPTPDTDLAAVAAPAVAGAAVACDLVAEPPTASTTVETSATDSSKLSAAPAPPAQPDVATGTTEIVVPHAAETLDSAVGTVPMFAAVDVHELQYGVETVSEPCDQAPDQVSAGMSAERTSEPLVSGGDSIPPAAVLEVEQPEAEASHAPAMVDVVDEIEAQHGEQLEDQLEDQLEVELEVELVDHPTDAVPDRTAADDLNAGLSESVDAGAIESDDDESSCEDDRVTAEALDEFDVELDVEDDVEDDDDGEEVARAETEVMSEVPEVDAGMESASEPPIVEIETFARPVSEPARDVGAEPLSLFSGLADDRWIDTRAR